ncbi:OmpA family protein [Brucepastera parasyntrophica]|uniref:OmpA family protein n=1 Tax=Brucepastera parasyntrophica TaxID=2880008 RepID=UPI00210CEC65|nr:OmpA family protein [Brucepastera parasyntrophica]ULQ60690.1 OmpA family protein [Brucepastera parasyntrophica]
MKKRLRTGIVFFIFSILPFFSAAETFRYRFFEGDSYRINSVVRETVYINRRYSHSAEITNRITVQVSDVDKKAGDSFYSARHYCTFMTSEQTNNRSFTWGREYESIFRRDEVGVYTIGDEYFMPVVRNVPTFPEYNVEPGDTWTGTGEEVHDLRDQLGLEKPFRVPFEVSYLYKETVEEEGKTLHHIQAEYTLFFETPGRPSDYSVNYPVNTQGFSRQQIYWDNEAGMIQYYTEEFHIRMQLASGIVLEFRGEAEATVTENTALDRTRIVREMNEEIARLNIPDTLVSETEEGITITLENIQFEPDSANLLPLEKEKITRLAALLERYPDKELLISGHTALAGTAGSRQKLSEARAEAVAAYLVQMGVRSKYNVYTRGFGAEKPLVPNTTEANRSRNRRVEITILEK